MKLGIIACALLLLLSACKETNGNIDSDKNPATQIAESPTSPVTFEAVKLDYVLPKQVAGICKQEVDYEKEEIPCPEINIAIAKISPEWIEQDLNFIITNDNNPKLIKFRRSMESFALSQIEDGSTLGYAWHIMPHFMGMHNQVAQFGITIHMNVGGAHGMDTASYYLYDLALGSRITLEDLYDSDDVDDEPSLMDLLVNAYRAFLASEHSMSPQEIAEHESAYPITMTDNVYFGEKGLVFYYDAYALGPYAMGPVALEIAYDKLSTHLRPEYLPNP